ncbi:NAD-dependent epimerase/dehydratase family protein [Leifsonia sp. NPDC058230]|uniref:NAD-dependent epimerase/dehydratase family protein n=1 Tax=Leifsonia sp. NPDC058230 TaxID=3346391 RepID=UPI0036DC90F2
MRVLVTGAAGFIGSYLARELLARGDEVVGVDSVTPYYDTAIKRANLARLVSPAFRFVEIDLVTVTADQLAGFEVDAIVHLAGQPGVRGSWGSQFDSYTHANVEATQRLLEAVKGLERRPRFVYASSSSIYGQAESYPTDERALPQPFSPYGVTKLAGEHLVNLYRANFDLDTVAFRFFTVYGPGQRPDMAFTRFLRAADEGGPITIYGDGEQIRDFTFVGDIVDALILAVNAEGPMPPVMNLSGGSSVSVNEVLETIREITGRELDVTYLDAVLGDVFRTGGSNELARTALGWEPRRSLREGLTEQWQWVSGGAR